MFDLPQFAPTSESVGLLNAPLGAVVDDFKAGFAASGSELTQRELRGPLDERFRAIEPLTIQGRRRFLMVPTAIEGWTAIFDNSAMGSDVDHPMRKSAARMNCAAVYARATDGTYPSVQFALYSGGPYATGNVRTVFAANDGGTWRFDAYGEVQPYEEVEAYKARRKRDRLTPEMLERYMAALGFDITSPSGLSPAPGALLETTQPEHPKAQHFTFAEAQARR